MPRLKDVEEKLYTDVNRNLDNNDKIIYANRVRVKDFPFQKFDTMPEVDTSSIPTGEGN